MNPKVARAVAVIALLTAVGRFFIVPRLTGIPSSEGAYEAFAHLFVGGLIGISLYDWSEKLGPARLYGVLAIALTVLEVVMFVAQKGGADHGRLQPL